MFNFERPLFKWACLVILAGVLYAAGVIPAVIPQSVPPAYKTGNNNRFQLSGISSATAGDAACFDANANITNVGCSSGGAGSGGITVYSGLFGIALTGTAFLPFGGGAIASTTEADVQTPIQVVTTLSKLGVGLSAAPGVGNSIAFLLRDNTAGTSISCTVSGVSTTCSDTTHSATTVAGHVYDFRITFTGTILVTPVVKVTMLAGATAPSFSVITSGTNTTAAMVLGTGSSLTTSGTGTNTANGLRAYTVATLPGSPVSGSAAYVTDGNSTLDCVTGMGSNKVLCVFNGSAWAFPGPTSGGSGSFVILESHTASNSAALNFTSCISSTYDSYLVQFMSLQPATDAAAIHMQVSTDGGSTYDTTSGHYAWNAFTMVSNTQAANGSTSDSAISFTGGGPSNTQSFAGSITLYDPLNASLFKLTSGVTTDVDSGGTRLVTFTTSGTYAQAAAYNAFRILAASGNLTSGTVRCYGLAH